MKVIIIGDRVLRVQGKIEHSILTKLLGDKLESESDSDWFFIDYSPSDIPLKSKFDLLLSSEGKVSKSPSDIIVETVIDSFGNLLNGIPRGYKTVVKLGFTNKIPQLFQSLPSLKGWKSTLEEIMITNIEDNKFDEYPDIWDDVYKLMISDLKHTSPHWDKMNKNEFFDRLKYLGIEDYESFLTVFTNMGLIKEGNREELEFKQID
jgi:hypothetical protein